MKDLITVPRIIHFEIETEDPERVIGFYEKVFGWKFSKWQSQRDYWLIKTGEDSEPGIDGDLKKGDPAGIPCSIIGVPSVDDFIKKIENEGGKVLLPKTAVPGVGYYAYFKDTEGNTLGIAQMDSSAK